MSEQSWNGSGLLTSSWYASYRFLLIDIWHTLLLQQLVYFWLSFSTDRCQLRPRCNYSYWFCRLFKRKFEYRQVNAKILESIREKEQKVEHESYRRIRTTRGLLRDDVQNGGQRYLNTRSSIERMKTKIIEIEKTYQS